VVTVFISINCGDLAMITGKMYFLECNALQCGIQPFGVSCCHRSIPVSSRGEGGAW
jgi:hypothetical protein